MITRDEIMAEVSRIPEHRLEDLYLLIREFEEQSSAGNWSGRNALARLRQIRISAAPDFSTTTDLYASETSDAG